MNLGESHYGTCIEESRAMSSRGDGEAGRGEQRGARRYKALEQGQVLSQGDGLTGISDKLEHLLFCIGSFTSFLGQDEAQGTRQRLGQ